MPCSALQDQATIRQDCDVSRPRESRRWLLVVRNEEQSRPNWAPPLGWTLGAGLTCSASPRRSCSLRKCALGHVELLYLLQYFNKSSSLGFTYSYNVRKACAREYIEFNSDRASIAWVRLKKVDIQLSVIIYVPSRE